MWVVSKDDIKVVNEDKAIKPFRYHSEEMYDMLRMLDFMEHFCIGIISSLANSTETTAKATMHEQLRNIQVRNVMQIS